MDLVVASLRIIYISCVILFQILVIPASIGVYQEYWKKGHKKITIWFAFIVLLMAIVAIDVDLFLLDILLGERPISAIWEIK